jgi:DNA-binding MurR/RpiR family transcriptional regulator
MQKKLLLELQGNMKIFSNVEQKIATLILQNPQKFTEYALTQVAELAGVSQGSVINFAKKFTGGGFPTLKVQVAASIAAYEEPFTVVSETDSVKEVFQKTQENVKTALDITLAQNKEETMQAVAKAILRAQKVQVHAIYRTAAVATDWYFQLLQLGVAATFVQDSLLSAVSASRLTADDLFIAVSSSGRTKDVLDAAKLAKQNGTPVVCLTSSKNSPLAKMSDYVLLCAASGNSVIAKESEVLFSQLILCETLCSYLRAHIETGGQDNFYKMRKFVSLHAVQD